MMENYSLKSIFSNGGFIGRNFVSPSHRRRIALAGLAHGLTCLQLAAQTIIDDFQINQAAIGSNGVASVEGSTMSIVGGEREVKVTTLAGSISAIATLGLFQVVGDANANGAVEIRWDGTNHTAGVINTHGLNGINLTNGGANAFLIGLVSVTGNPSLTLSIDSGTDTASVTLPVLQASPNPQWLRLAFSSLVGTASPTNVGSVRLQINNLANASVQISFLRSGSYQAATPDVTLTDVVLVDNDGNGKASAGDTLRYYLRISNNTGGPMTNVSFALPTPANAANSAVGISPLAHNDGPSTSSTPGSPWHGVFNVPFILSASAGLLTNDYLGTPAAAVASFGGGVFPITTKNGVTDYAAGSTAMAPGVGSLTVNADGSLAFTPVPSFTGTLNFLYRLRNGSGISDGMATIAIGTRPGAVDDSYTVTGNTQIDTSLIPQSTLANDTGDALTLVAHGTPAHGDLTVASGSGHFSYTPSPGYTGPDTFSYTVGNGFGTVSATVHLTVTNLLWYIDNSVGSMGDGRSSTPFNSLAAFNAANTGTVGKPGANSLLFLRQGSGVYQDNVFGGPAITLMPGQQLIGDGWSGTFPGAFGFNFAAGSKVVPLTGTDPIVANTEVSGNGIGLTTGNTVRGVTAGDTPNGYGFSGAAVGTFIIEDCSKNGSGGAIQIGTSGTAGHVNFPNFNTLRSTSALGDAVSLNGLEGTLVATQGSITAPAGAGVHIIGGGGSLTYGGDITKNNPGRLVDIESKSGGLVTFSGALTQGDPGATGIFIANNGAGNSTIEFTGNMVLNTGVHPAFTAIGGGAISATGPGSTIVTTTGIGVTISNTTILGGGVVFKSVNTGGAANGIVLANTGAGTFTVTGDGATDPNDVTIGRTTSKIGGGTVAIGSGGSVSGTTGPAVSLSGVNTVILRNMILSTALGAVNDGRDGLSASNVSALTLDNTLITSIANNHGLWGANLGGLTLQHCSIGKNATASGTETVGVWNVRLDNLNGTALVANSDFDTSRQNVFGVVENGTSLASVQISNSRFQHADLAAVGNDGLYLSASASARINATISNSVFKHFYGNGVQYVGNDQSGGGLISVIGSTFDDDGTSINLEHQGQGKNLQFNIRDNHIRDSGIAPGVPGNNLDAINLKLESATTAASQMEGYVTGNTIGAQALAGSGSGHGNGINVEATGAGTVTAVVSGNSVVQTPNDHTVWAHASKQSAGGGVATMNLTITGNTLLSRGTGNGLAALGIDCGAGAFPGDSPTICAKLTGNIDFVGDSQFASVYAALTPFSSADNPTLLLVGYTGAKDDDNAVTSFLSSAAVAAVNMPGALFARGGGHVSSTASCKTPSFTQP